jgi:hypothetical protein
MGQDQPGQIWSALLALGVLKHALGCKDEVDPARHLFGAL